jgi:probable F420-dependent oxidoreductase
MRLDLVVPNEGPYAREAVMSCPEFEAMGFTGLWFTDHVVGQRAYTKYSDMWLEIFAVLSHVAAVTRTVRLGTGVLVVPYRDPVLAAKQLATIDVLSDGRLDLGVGTGWSKGEYHALGRGHLFDQRGPYTNEALDVMLRCWQGGEFGYEGQWVNFRRLGFAPTPVQKPRIPLWVGSLGTAGPPMRRAAKYADVWHPGLLTPSELAEGSRRLNELAGREVPVSIRTEFAAGTAPREILDKLLEYREAGCIQAAVEVRADSHGEFVEAAQKLATLIPDLQS